MKYLILPLILSASSQAAFVLSSTSFDGTLWTYQYAIQDVASFTTITLPITDKAELSNFTVGADDSIRFKASKSRLMLDRINATGDLTFSFASTFRPELATIDIGGYQQQVFAPVPEPGVCLLGGIGMMMFLRRKRKNNP